MGDEERERNVVSLEQRLLRARRQLTGMLSFDGAAPSALLHPFSPSCTTSYEDLKATIGDAQTTLYDFINQSDSFRGPEQANILATLREQSHHNHAICEVQDQMGRFGKRTTPLTNYFSICAHADIGTSQWPTSNLTKAREALQQLIEALEKLAKDTHLESFADQSTGSEHDTKYTLTLAGEILVIDADITLQQTPDTFYTPSIKVKVSFATDTSHKERGEQLARIIQSNMQSVALSIFGVTDADDHVLECFCETLTTLKGYDLLSSTYQIEGYPDLFALLDGFCASVNSDTNLKQPYLYRTHTAKPQFSVLICVAPVSAVEALQLEVEEGNIKQSKDGKVLQIQAHFHPPVLMPKTVASRLARIAGIIDTPPNKSDDVALRNDASIVSLTDPLAPTEQAILVKMIPLASVQRLPSLYDELVEFFSTLTIPNRPTPSDQ